MPLITAPWPNFLRRSSIARSAWAERRSSMSVSSACEPGRSALTPAPISRNAVPSISLASISRVMAKIFAASCVGAWIDCERVRCLKSAVFSFRVMVNPESSPFLRRRETFSDSRHSVRSSVAKSRMSLSNVVSLEMVLAPPIGNKRPIADAAPQPPQPAALGRELLHQLDFVGALQIGDGAKTALDQSFLGCRADAENEADRFFRQHGAGLGLVERGKAARLVHVGGGLGQGLVAGQPDRNRDPDVALD